MLAKMEMPMLKINRRVFIAGAMAVNAGLARAYAETSGQAPFALPPLPYAPGALEPHVDAMTMEIHHGKHHQAYVNNLNNALKDHGEVAKMPLEEILAKLGELPDAIRTAVRNNAGGHANHTMFWQIMGPGGGEPAAAIGGAIERDFGGLEKLKEEFNAAGSKVFGSGWVFVAVDRGGKLSLVTKPNQDTPLMEGARVLMGNDVWEHAYYLKYQNRRADYLKAWWNVVNWKAVGERYEAAKAGMLAI
jgi:Fe-Mn family superoxide dismutase